jgi:drug/metabolite transporter (DMT)-like permease
MSSIVVCIVAVAVFWGGWPLVARLAGETGIAGSIIMAVMMLISIAAAGMYTGVTLPSLRATGVLLVAGVMMGIGLIAFYAVSSNPSVELSVVIPVLDTSMLLVSVIGGIWFFGEAVTVRKLIGIALLVIGIVTLRPDK